MNCKYSRFATGMAVTIFTLSALARTHSAPLRSWRQGSRRRSKSFWPKEMS